MKYIFILFLVFLSRVHAQSVLFLYSDTIPNSKPGPDEETAQYTKDSILVIGKISRPTLSIYLPPRDKANGTAVIICPGGGYWIVAAAHEGADVARKLNEAGIAAFVLKYRIPSDQTMVNKEWGPLQDAQRAIQMVREHARQWGIRKNRIGIMGFSAGGHLASTAGTHFNRAYIPNPRNIPLRPDFMVLVYPVISFEDSIGHPGSRTRLLGDYPGLEKIHEYSNEEQVNRYTPGTFLVHAQDDSTVSIKNSYVFKKALDRNGVPSRLFIYKYGGHGFGLTSRTSPEKWMDSCIPWILQRKWKK